MNVTTTDLLHMMAEAGAYAQFSDIDIDDCVLVTGEGSIVVAAVHLLDLITAGYVAPAEDADHYTITDDGLEQIMKGVKPRPIA